MLRGRVLRRGLPGLPRPAFRSAAGTEAAIPRHGRWRMPGRVRGRGRDRWRSRGGRSIGCMRWLGRPCVFLVLIGIGLLRLFGLAGAQPGAALGPGREDRHRLGRVAGAGRRGDLGRGLRPGDIACSRDGPHGCSLRRRFPGYGRLPRCGFPGQFRFFPRRRHVLLRVPGCRSCAHRRFQVRAHGPLRSRCDGSRRRCGLLRHGASLVDGVRHRGVRLRRRPGRPRRGLLGSRRGRARGSRGRRRRRLRGGGRHGRRGLGRGAGAGSLFPVLFLKAQLGFPALPPGGEPSFLSHPHSYTTRAWRCAARPRRGRGTRPAVPPAPAGGSPSTRSPAPAPPAG